MLLINDAERSGLRIIISGVCTFHASGSAAYGLLSFPCYMVYYTSGGRRYDTVRDTGRYKYLPVNICGDKGFQDFSLPDLSLPDTSLPDTSLPRHFSTKTHLYHGHLSTKTLLYQDISLPWTPLYP